MALHACLALFRMGKLLPFRISLRLLGLIASALVVIPFGRLYMRGLLGPIPRSGPFIPRLSPCPSHCVECMVVLQQSRQPAFLTEGMPMGTVLTKKVITTDASLFGREGHPRGQNGEQSVGTSPSVHPHKLPGTLGSVPGTETLPSTT